MKKYLFPIVLAVPLVLASCGQSDFKNEAERDAAFEAVTCKAAIASEVNYGIDVSVDIMADRSNYSTEDVVNALEVLSMRQDVVDSAWETYLSGVDEDFTPPTHYAVNPEGDDHCYGWVWDVYLEQQRESESYADFTYEDAEQAGVLQ